MSPQALYVSCCQETGCSSTSPKTGPSVTTGVDTSGCQGRLKNGVSVSSGEGETVLPSGKGEDWVLGTRSRTVGSPNLQVGVEADTWVWVSGDEELEFPFPALDGLRLLKDNEDGLAPEVDV